MLNTICTITQQLVLLTVNNLLLIMSIDYLTNLLQHTFKQTRAESSFNVSCVVVKVRFPRVDIEWNLLTAQSDITE